MHTQQSPTLIIVIARVFASMTRVSLTSKEWTMTRGREGGESTSRLADGGVSRLEGGNISVSQGFPSYSLVSSVSQPDSERSNHFVARSPLSLINSRPVKIILNGIPKRNTHFPRPRASVRLRIIHQGSSNHLNGCRWFWIARSSRAIPTGHRNRGLKIPRRTRRGILENLRKPDQCKHLRRIESSKVAKVRIL